MRTSVPLLQWQRVYEQDKIDGGVVNQSCENNAAVSAPKHVLDIKLPDGENGEVGLVD